MTKSSEGALAPEQRWALVLAAAGSFVVVLDLLVVATALTAIRIDLGATVEQLEWTINAYTFSFAVLLMTAAGLGETGSGGGAVMPPGSWCSRWRRAGARWLPTSGY